MPDLVPYHKLAEIDIDQIIERIASGEYASHIARELGCTAPALGKRLRAHPEIAIARETGIEQRLDDGLDQLSEAVELLSRAARAGDVSLACALDREVKGKDAVLRRLEWRASVEAPHRWSSTQRIEQHVKHSYSNVLRDLDTAIDSESEQAQEKEVDSSEDGAG